MPYNKVGSYNIYFDLLNGDREMVATPIEVLLEINYITGWEGNTTITWSDGGRVYVPAAKFDGVKAGAKIRFYYTQKDQTWAQAQINYGDWSGLVFPELSGNTLVPTDIYGWFSDGILDRCTEFTLTKEILDNIQAKKGDAEDQKNVGIIIQGSDLTFTKVEILQEISKEKTIWEGEAKPQLPLFRQLLPLFSRLRRPPLLQLPQPRLRLPQPQRKRLPQSRNTFQATEAVTAIPLTIMTWNICISRTLTF
ncbi:MAG: hypothetical protein IJY73_03795 [Oscillospiraceae bacterium]|nr:hypothetical protein [Oscillospiraceae bacterium]